MNALKPARLPLLLALLGALALAGCSSRLARDSSSCLDRDDCDQPQVASKRPEALFWYCYGASRDEPWDCSNVKDDSKIRIIPGPLPEDDEALTAAVTLPDETSPAPSLKAEGFAVQLVALETVSAVEEFALEHGLDEPVYFRIRGPADQPLYVLILGYYGSREEAQAAAADWEATHQTGEPPLIKPVEALQAAMEAPEQP